MTDTITAGIYCRISLASMGDTTKTDDQQRICRELAGRLGWEVADVYSDNSVSAWQPNRKRKDWDRMTADAESGRINALIVYHGDRLIRRPEDLYTLLRWARTRGFRLASPTGERDLGNPDDEFILWIEAAMANRESANTSRRRRNELARKAREGIAPSAGSRYGRGFGYDSSGRIPVPAEAEAIRIAAERVLNGESVTVIARDFDAAGVRAVSGAPLNYQSLKRILTRKRIAGLMPDGTPGSWEPILDRETWEMVCTLLTDREPVRAGTEGGKYLLSGIATCWACRKPVQRQSAGRAGSVALGYGCVTPGCRKVHRNMAMLDAYVTGAVLSRLSHPGNPPGRVPDKPGLATQLHKLTEARTELAAKVADPQQPHLDLLLARLDRLDGQLAELREMTGDATRSRLVDLNTGISREDWDRLPLATRRALVKATYSVELLPTSKRGPGFNPDDVQMTPL